MIIGIVGIVIISSLSQEIETDFLTGDDQKKDLPIVKTIGRDVLQDSVFKKLRWIIADDKRIPYLAVLFNSTIEALLNEPPTTCQQLLSLPEFIRNSTNIRGYESIILKIIDEYKKVGSKEG